MDIAEDIDRVFNPEGLLSSVVTDYKYRQEQCDMAKAVSHAIVNKTPLVCEAGTGTGKTFAYLIPAFYYGQKIIVATGTKTLQDQLFDKDIQTVRKALKLPITVAKLKGRANYLCHHQIEKTRSERVFTSVRDVEMFRQFEQMLETSTTGDISEVEGSAGSSSVRASVVSTRDNCLGSDCPYIGDCFVLKARKQALAAEVVVVNHHLFFADLALKKDGFGELLPECDVVIFDEAHQISDVATNFFGESFSTNQTNELLRDIRYGIALLDVDELDLDKPVAAFEKGVRELRLSFEGISGRFEFSSHLKKTQLIDAVQSLLDSMNQLAKALSEIGQINLELQTCIERLNDLALFLRSWIDIDVTGYIRWFEVMGQAVRLHRTPIDVADILNPIIEEGERSWIFTSATLSISGDGSYFTSQLGLNTSSFRSWESPFDYSSNSLLYVPRNMPLPAHRDYHESVIDASIDAVIAANGRCMMLFTSLSAMRFARDKLTEKFQDRDIDMPILLQGDGAKYELLNRFKSLKNAVLIGSHSFWEGVDVRGDGLVLVVIDKLPFSVPDDPITAGRIEHLRSMDKNPFMDYQVPEAIILLKQGAGRLIRDEDDKGVLIICDPRLLTKPYGRKIWQSLPPMRRTQESEEVLQFLRSV